MAIVRCAWCQVETIDGHDCPQKRAALAADLAQNSAARAGHEAGAAAAETVAGILHGGATAAERAGDDEG